MAEQARIKTLHFNHQHSPAKIMVFDDVETFEHSKCKPLAITLAVEEPTRRILGFKVSSMPAKGLLAALSRKKYGKRKDERPENRKLLFEELVPLVTTRSTYQIG